MGQSEHMHIVELFFGGEYIHPMAHKLSCTGLFIIYCWQTRHWGFHVVLSPEVSTHTRLLTKVYQ